MHESRSYPFLPIRSLTWATGVSVETGRRVRLWNVDTCSIHLVAWYFQGFRALMRIQEMTQWQTRHAVVLSLFISSLVPFYLIFTLISFEFFVYFFCAVFLFLLHYFSIYMFLLLLSHQINILLKNNYLSKYSKMVFFWGF